MASKAVSLRVSDELLAKLTADANDGESLGGTIQRILLNYYALTLDSDKVEPIQTLVVKEVERQTSHLMAAYSEVKGEIEILREEITKIQVTKTTRRKPLTS